MGKCGERMRQGHAGFIFEEIGRLPLETGEPEEVTWEKSASGNTALRVGEVRRGMKIQLALTCSPPPCEALQLFIETMS